MYGFYDKKNLNLIILKILWEHTDENHRLQQQEIVALLKTQYGIEIDRRTVKNNVEALKNLLYDTAYEISTEKGYCLIGREFTDAELRMLIDSVLFSRNISQKQAKDLIDKIRGLSSKYFTAKVNHIHNLPELSYADQKQQVLYNLDIIHDAISEKRKISFVYNTYGTDFKLHPKREEEYVVNPYQMIANHGRYYLIANFDKYDDIAHLRIDKMTDVRVLEQKAKKQELLSEMQNGLNLPRYLSEHVYMYSGKSVLMVFRCNETLMDELVDWFGKAFRVIEKSNGEITIRILGNEQAMYYWALQYGDCVEVMEPKDLREKVKAAVDRMAEKYSEDKSTNKK